MSETTTPEQRANARRALLLNDEALVAECNEEFYVAGGPGGQHRNKTESAVRLRHRPTDVCVTATERRSQAQNRGMAVERLRAQLATLSIEPKTRKKTRPSRGSKRRRLESKKRQGEKKASRKGSDW